MTIQKGYNVWHSENKEAIGAQKEEGEHHATAAGRLWKSLPGKTKMNYALRAEEINEKSENGSAESIRSAYYRKQVKDADRQEPEKQIASTVTKATPFFERPSQMDS